MPRRKFILAAACVAGASGANCPGSFHMPGYGPVQMIPTGWKDPTSPQVDVDGKGLLAHMDARAYFAERCNAGVYSNEDYLALNLLGKSIKYTTDLRGAGCGCNAAFYLTSLRQNPNPSDCSDYYCDANNVCGQSCAEIDIQEANQFAWHSTLHSKSDRFGVGGGYGGGDGYNGARDWGSQQYGPGGQCVDTAEPFEVVASFPVDGQGMLAAMSVELSQQGKSCTVKANLGSYNGMGELSAALKAGMTPIVSYWSDDAMLWMDGKGMDGQGPCEVDDAAACSKTVKFSDFSVQPIGAPPPQAQPIPAPVPQPVPQPHPQPPPPVTVPVAPPQPTPPKPAQTPSPRPTVPPSPSPANFPVPVVVPAPVPIPVPVPFPASVDGNKRKVAIFQALGKLCGTGSTVHRIGSTLIGYVFTCADRLHTSPYQACIAFSAMLIGLTSSWDGPFMYRALFTIVAAIVSASIGDYEVTALELVDEQASHGFIVFQVLVAMAIATHYGFDGAQVLFGIILGLFGAHGCGGFIMVADGHVHGIAVLWYSLFAFFGGLIFTVWRSLLLKTLAPLFGGFMVVTGFCEVLARMWSACGFAAAPFLPRPDKDWASNALVLVGMKGRGAVAGGVGCALLALVFMGFGGRKKFAVGTLLVYIGVNGIAAIVLNLGRWLWPLFGCLLWAGVTALAAIRQLNLTDSVEIQGCFKDAMSTKSLLMSRTDVELPAFVSRTSAEFGNGGGGLGALTASFRGAFNRGAGSPYRAPGMEPMRDGFEPSAPPLSQSPWRPKPRGGGYGRDQRPKR